MFKWFSLYRKEGIIELKNKKRKKCISILIKMIKDYINAIIYYRNYLRPSYALNYKTPIEYKTQLGFK